MEEGITVGSLKVLLTFPFRGKDWESRFLLGALLVFVGLWVPILPLVFVFGYLLRLMRRTIEGEEPSLVAWEDWGGLGLDGIRAAGVSLVYLLPGTLIGGGGLAFYTLTSTVLPLLAEGRMGEGPIIVLVLFAVAVLFLSLFVGSVLFLLGFAPLPAALARLAVFDDFGTAFHIREWWSLIRSDPLGYFAAWVVLFGLGGIAYLGLTLLGYTGLLCCLVPILGAPALFYLGLVGAVLFGWFYREHTAL